MLVVTAALATGCGDADGGEEQGADPGPLPESTLPDVHPPGVHDVRPGPLADRGPE